MTTCWWLANFPQGVNLIAEAVLSKKIEKLILLDDLSDSSNRLWHDLKINVLLFMLFCDTLSIM